MLRYIIITLAVLVIIAACIEIAVMFTMFRYVAWKGGDYTIDLPHGYSLTRIYSNTVELVAPNRLVLLGPTIDGYRVYDQLVIGHMQASPEEKYVEGKTGYFILNTKAGKLNSWANRDQWIQALRKHGIKSPVLMKPKNPRAI